MLVSPVNVLCNATARLQPKNLAENDPTKKEEEGKIAKNGSGCVCAEGGLS